MNLNEAARQINAFKEYQMTKLLADICRREDVLYIDPARITYVRHQDRPNTEFVQLDQEPIAWFTITGTQITFESTWTFSENPKNESNQEDD